jgi:SAM-dependent methyltransferase
MSEYVTDVTYVPRVDSNLAPARLRLCAAFNGFVPPPAEDFVYCELGCGTGDAVATLAAANPRASFYGVDLNPEHVRCGREIAAGLDNITFLERDFEDLDDVPELDYISAHGVLSWIGPAKREAVLAFAKRRLKPGGLLYVSYNAMPGWAAVEPLRQLLMLPGGSTSVERAEKGMAFAKALRDAGALYFASNPTATDMLAEMEKQGHAYIAHEYLNAHWVPMYFARIAWEMAQHDMQFVGGLPLYVNYRDLVLPGTTAKLFEGMRDRLEFESLKDFALNELFRMDVYIKGRGRDAHATNAYLDSTPFGMLSLPAKREVKLPHQAIRYEQPIYDTLFPALYAGAANATSLAARFPELGLPKIRSALIRMLLGGHAVPFVRESNPRSGGLSLSPFNRRLLERRALASPVLGSAITLPEEDATGLRAVLDDPAKLADQSKLAKLRELEIV